MTQQEIEYFGGPEDGKRQPIHLEQRPNWLWPLPVTWRGIAIEVVGGDYRPERLPNGVWRLHFFDTVAR